MHYGKIQCLERGGGSYPPSRSLWTLKKALKLLITNPTSPLRNLYDHPFYIYLIFPQGITYNPCLEGFGGRIHPLITLYLKEGTRTFDYRSNEPPPNFIRWPFLYKPEMSQDITYNLWPEGCGRRVVILKDIIFGCFNYVEQNGYLKILIECVWGNGGCGKGVSCPPITFAHQKGR